MTRPAATIIHPPWDDTMLSQVRNDTAIEIEKRLKAERKDDERSSRA